MKTTTEMIEVMQAFMHGEKIEVLKALSGWTHTPMPGWDWATYDYRVKPEPQHVWAVIGADGRTVDAAVSGKNAGTARKIWMESVPSNAPYRIARMVEVEE